MRLSPAELQQFGATHEVMTPVLGEMEGLARHLYGRPGPGAFRALDRVIDALHGPLVSHLDFEEELFYPAVADDMSGRHAVESMVEDHREITARLAALTAARGVPGVTTLEDSLRVCQELYTLAALLRLHLRKEQVVWVPIARSQLEEDTGS